ncbi:MAG: hypothetical protein U9R20_02635 [Thermodesulfobacteriota bacterium]|nr:hypothetical protein [Thermodesulfobacteriota bacterium]
MKISPKMKNQIIEEIEHVVYNMEKSHDPVEMLYYFSAIHGLINRVFNMEYDPELVFMHHVLSAVHTGFLGRIDAMRKGDPVIVLDDSYFKKLISLSINLKDKISENGNVDDTLKEFIVLLYATTGNGYYLKHKGLLKM